MAQVETPIASIPSGKYYESQGVLLSCATEGAVIYYTIIGTTPDEGGILYDGEIYVPRTMTLKAIGIKAGYEDSEIMTEEYSLWVKTNNIISGSIIQQEIKGVIE